MITYFGIGYMSKPKNLIMILKKEPYQVMVSGEKRVEYRDKTPSGHHDCLIRMGLRKSFNTWSLVMVIARIDLNSRLSLRVLR